ncbi:hypothetical protein WAK64_12085 [Bacillus spongiae]|uniref:Uncharacterized protein n=1 Tax=Bacillus spongiae TaxID=2683610 RepID=A0ABU8HET7_9BACI
MKRKVCFSASLFSLLFGMAWCGHESVIEKKRLNYLEKQGVTPISTFQDAEPVIEPIPFGSREYIRFVQ